MTSNTFIVSEADFKKIAELFVLSSQPPVPQSLSDFLLKNQRNDKFYCSKGIHSNIGSSFAVAATAAQARAYIRLNSTIHVAKVVAGGNWMVAEKYVCINSTAPSNTDPRKTRVLSFQLLGHVSSSSNNEHKSSGGNMVYTSGRGGGNARYCDDTPRYYRTSGSSAI